MSKSANAGELTTPIRVHQVVIDEDNTDEDGYPIQREENIYRPGAILWVKWVNVHGAEAITAFQMKLREPATITCRYTPKINTGCIIYKGNDPVPFEVISVDDVENRNEWLEIKVQRKVSGK